MQEILDEQILRDLKYLEELYEVAKTMEERMDIKDQQRMLYKKLQPLLPQKPEDSDYECEGCSG